MYRHATIKSSMRRSRNEHVLISPNPSGKAVQWLTNRPAKHSVRDTALDDLMCEEPIMFQTWITWPAEGDSMKSELSHSKSPVYVQVSLWFGIYYHFFFTFLCLPHSKSLLTAAIPSCYRCIVLLLKSLYFFGSECTMFNNIQEQHVTSPLKHTPVSAVD